MTKQIQTRKTFHNKDWILNIYERLIVFHVMKPCKFYLKCQVLQAIRGCIYKATLDITN